MATQTEEHETISFLGNDKNCPTLKEPLGDESNLHEKIVNELGFPGRYQVFQIILCNLACISGVFVMLNIVFIGFSPPHKCHLPNDTTLLTMHRSPNNNAVWVQATSCEINLMINLTGHQEKVSSMDCIEGYDYSGRKSSSMASEWDLVCDKDEWIPLVQTMFTLGIAIASILVSSLADRIGRKYVYLFGMLAVFSSELGLAFAPNIYVVIVLRVLTGISTGGLMLSVFVTASELVTSRYRQTVAAIHCVWWAVCTGLLAAVAHMCRDCSWRQFQIITAFFSVPGCIAAFFTNDSPAWYYAKGQYKAAERILVIACKMNGKDSGRLLSIFRKGVQFKAALASKSGERKNVPREAMYTFFDIFRSWRLLMIFCVGALSWFTVSIAYYGLIMTSSTLVGDRILNFFFLAILDIPGNLLIMLLLVYFGRRTIVIIFFCLAFVTFLVLSIITFFSLSEGFKVGYTVLSLTGKFSVGASFSIVYNYTPELFPTTIRSVGVGSCAFFARVGGMVAPFLLPLYNEVQWAPSVLITGFFFTVPRFTSHFTGNQRKTTPKLH